MECQARSDKKLDFAFYASLASINVVKTMLKEYKINLTIGQVKSLMFKVNFARRIFERCGIDPKTALNAKLVKEIFGFEAEAA